MYERITPAQQQAVSNILTSGEEKKKFRDEMRVVSAQPGPICAQIPNLHIPGKLQQQLPVWPVMSPRVSFPSMAAINSTGNSSGFQCYGCHINIYQGPVMQTRQPREEIEKENVLSEQEFARFCDF